MLGGAFLTHDLCHRYVTYDNKYQDTLSWFFGEIIFGVSSPWWREEHFDHHGFTNVYENNPVLVLDPQSSEDFWCHSKDIMPLYDKFYHYLFITQQWWLIWPVLIFFARVGIQVDCWIPQAKEFRKNWINLIGWAFHWAWVLVFSYNSTRPFLCYFIIHCYQGTLGVQLICNHIHRKWKQIEQIKHENYGKRMIEVSVNYKTSRWFDWWYGGLHFHIEHHVFPKMPRYN